MPSILRLKEDLPYPIEIVSIDCQEGSNVEKKEANIYIQVFQSERDTYKR